MNCVVCGNTLLFDRVSFRCSCGAYVHSYCWEKHVLQAHQPPYEVGTVNLHGEFRKEEPVHEEAAPAQVTSVQEQE
jgi:hypothetical protein